MPNVLEKVTPSEISPQGESKVRSDGRISVSHPFRQFHGIDQGWVAKQYEMFPSEHDGVPRIMLEFHKIDAEDDDQDSE